MRVRHGAESSLRGRPEFLLAADVRLQGLRDRDGAVRFLAVLEDRHEAAGRRLRRRVEGIRGELLPLTSPARMLSRWA